MRLGLSTKLILMTGLVIGITIGISFYIITRHQEGLILKQAENEARAIFRQIIITRRWIADHGGIFVEKKSWVSPNTYLSQIGEEMETTDIRGRRLVKENPAMVTRELSRYAKEKELYWFRITSLKLVNPLNAPDEWEGDALREFELYGKKELTALQTIDGRRYMRYISPLYVEEACLRCHGRQGYKIGDVRGALSITIPLEDVFLEISANRKRMLIAGIIIILVLMLTLHVMIKRTAIVPLQRLSSAMKGFSEGEYPSEGFGRTGDEIEELNRAFSIMAEKISEYHLCLHDRIRSAVTELQEANKRLQEINQRKSDFIARASHELRTPLTSIKGAMDYISQRLSKAIQQGHNTSLDDIYVFFDVIKRSSERLIRMVNNMLDIEKIEMGVYEFHFSDVNLSHLIRDVAASFRAETEDIGISVDINIPPNLRICADGERISQVLINLLSNAIKFSPKGSDVTIFSYIERDYVVTEIWDNGPGIPPSEQERIFEKFYKIGNKEGTGLGLAICKGIIVAHNGIIGVKSDGSNGSCFYFKLPYIVHDAVKDDETEYDSVVEGGLHGQSRG